MNNSTLAKKFIDGAIKGHGSNMFIHGDTIYSYGYHFPIARRDKTFKFLFNSDGYSNTTARHKSHVKRWMGEDFLVIRDCSLKYVAEQYDKNRELLSFYHDKLNRARTEKSRVNYQYKINFLESQNNKLEFQDLVIKDKIGGD